MASGVKLTMDILKHRLLNINPDIEIISEVYKNTKQNPVTTKCYIGDCIAMLSLYNIYKKV